jgi:hypothetical protein
LIVQISAVYKRGRSHVAPERRTATDKSVTNSLGNEIDPAFFSEGQMVWLSKNLEKSNLRENRQVPDMNSYVYLISEMKGSQERLRRLFQSPAEMKATGKVRAVAQRVGANLAGGICCFSCLVVFAGVLMAAQWPRHLFWLAVWPIPAALASTVFVFVQQGFYFDNGVLVLGHRRVKTEDGDQS